jgi:SAM-dependent methyltransferase
VDSQVLSSPLVCIACESPLLEGHFQRKDYPNSIKEPDAPLSILICNHCDLGVAHPMPSEEFLKKLYDSEGAEYWGSMNLKTISIKRYPGPYGLALARWKLIKPHLIEMNTKELTIIDVGAGFGFLGIVASQQTHLEKLEYIAIEPDKSMHKPMSDNWNNSGLRSALKTSCNLDDIDGQADVLVLSHILEHVPDPIDFLRKVLEKLKRGGLLFIDVPFHDEHFKPDVFPHLYFFSPQNLSLMLDRLELEKVDVAAWGCDWFDSPFMAKKMSCSYIVDQLVSIINNYIPMKASVDYFAKRYEVDQRSKNGIWVRGLARKPE